MFWIFAVLLSIWLKEQLFQKIVYACSSDNLYQLTDIKKTVVKWHISIWVYVKKKGRDEYEWRIWEKPGW